MKNREEYIESIYKKRDAALNARKKRRSYLTTAACIAVCFLTAFFLVPKDKPKIKEEQDYTIGSTSGEISYNATPEDFATSPADDGTFDFAEKAEGIFREESEATVSFGGPDATKSESVQSCTVATSAPQQPASSSTTKAVKTTTHKNSTSKNDVVGADDDNIDIGGIIDGLGSIKLPEFTINGNLFQGYRPEGFGSSLSPPKTTEPITEKAPPAPDTGSDDYSGVLSVARSYLSESELNEIDSSKTEISIQDSATDSTADTLYYYIVFQTDTKTIVIILDAETLDFISRNEYPIVKQSSETTTAPQTTAISETTTVTNPVAENS